MIGEKPVIDVTGKVMAILVGILSIKNTTIKGWENLQVNMAGIPKKSLT